MKNMDAALPQFISDDAIACAYYEKHLQVVDFYGVKHMSYIRHKSW
jgi:hypothetical protein